MLPPISRLLRGHLGADADTLEAIDDDAVFGLEARADHAQAFIQRPELDRARFHGIVVLHHEHDLARLVGRDRRIRQQQRLIGRGADQPHAAELSGQDGEIVVSDHRAAAQRAGRYVEPVVEEIHMPFMRGLGLASQRHLHRIGRIARARPLALEPQLVVLEVSRLVDVEIDVDRIERDDGGEQCRGAVVAALHEIADTDEMAADAAGDRRHHVGEFDIELGRLKRAFGDSLGGKRGLHCLAALVDDLFGDRAGLDKLQAAIELALGKLRLCPGVGKLAIRLVGHRLERPRVDDVKQVAGMHDVAVLELDTGYKAADAGADLNLFNRLEAAGELVPVGDGPFDRLRHRHRRRRRGRLRLRLLVAASEREREQHTDRCAAASCKAAKRTAIEPGRRSRILRSVSRTHFRLPRT